MLGSENIAVEACKTLNTLYDSLEQAGFDGDCDGYSLAFESKEGLPYLLNYHGVTGQIWLASPKSGAHHFRRQDGFWISTRPSQRPTDHELYGLLEFELDIILGKPVS